MDAAEAIIRLENFKKGVSLELSINWSQIVILAHLASANSSDNSYPYLSCAELVERTSMDKCWLYRNIRLLLQRNLIDTLKQPGPRSQVRAYTLTGKGSFYLSQALMPNGISIIRAFERT